MHQSPQRLYEIRGKREVLHIGSIYCIINPNHQMCGQMDIAARGSAENYGDDATEPVC